MHKVMQLPQDFPNCFSISWRPLSVIGMGQKVKYESVRSVSSVEYRTSKVFVHDLDI